MKCERPGCTGTIVEGYCDTCGMAPAREAQSGSSGTAHLSPGTAPAGPGNTPAGPASIPAASASTPGAPPPDPGSDTVVSRSASQRTTPSRTSSSSRGRGSLGSGLVDIPEVPFTDPADAVMKDPKVAESRRFCSACDSPVGRSKDGNPGRTTGFCPQCGTPFSFDPKLHPGDLIAGRYHVVGCLAHGGMGWIFLAEDRNLDNRSVVLKGLLDTGDADATAAAVAERRFLIEVEHRDVVKIVDSVQHEGDGYIVMEYVGGRSLKQVLVQRREANGGKPDPLPPGDAIAYMLAILPALGFLHGEGLLFCDFKLDNVIHTRHSLKLIDLGGVYRIDEPSQVVFGTAGYQAPEIAALGPSVESDLFTVARTLAVMCFDFEKYQTTYKFTLPDQHSVPVLARYDSLYRFILRATAGDRDDRFHAAEEMEEQLYGVLREVVAGESGKTVPTTSTLFTAPQRAGIGEPDWRALPRPLVASDDPAAPAPDSPVEVKLRLTATLTEVSDFDAALGCIVEIEAEDPSDWRAGWYRGLIALARERPEQALTYFRAAYQTLPGELSPKLGLAFGSETAGNATAAASWYEIVSRTDPSFTAAAFGLARCRLQAGDQDGALAAYQRVPESSSAYVDAQVERIHCLSVGLNGTAPPLDRLIEAGSILEGLEIEPERRARLAAEVLEPALALTRRDGDQDRSALLGRPVAQRDVRLGLEDAYRALARRAATGSERIELVDRANRVRPRTWT